MQKGHIFCSIFTYKCVSGENKIELTVFNICINFTCQSVLIDIELICMFLSEHTMQKEEKVWLN